MVPRPAGRGLLVAGTTSDAGKSLVTAGLCRWLSRKGVQVAPFKAQNMSNNSMACPDGSEIGRAQWLQALAARAVPEASMNPVLLKPGADTRSHVLLMGHPHGELGAAAWSRSRAELADVAYAALADLQSRFDVVIAEGAGSPAEVNLRAGDFVNMGLARHADLPVVVVGDIDRGGVLAAMFGTLALLSAEDQHLVCGWIVNKFRGEGSLLTPGLRALERASGRPVLGVIPWLEDVWLDSEDSLPLAGWASGAAGALNVAVVGFPRTSNATDIDPVAAEPGVRVAVTARPSVVESADVVILPGTRATVEDLGWLRRKGIDRALATRAASGRTILGICGGYQMLARVIEDTIESGQGRVPGLGLLPTKVTFRSAKHVATTTATWRGTTVHGYHIHHGRVVLDPAHSGGEPFLDGWRSGAVSGTICHGIFENDAFRRAWLTDAATRAGVAWTPTDPPVVFSDLRERMLDRIADAIEANVDVDRLISLIREGAPEDLPFVPPGAPA